MDNRHRWARYTRASDYSHSEGTENPIAKFERIMENCDQATLHKFYHGNMPEDMDGAQFLRSLGRKPNGFAYSPSTALAMTLR